MKLRVKALTRIFEICKTGIKAIMYILLPISMDGVASSYDDVPRTAL